MFPVTDWLRIPAAAERLRLTPADIYRMVDADEIGHQVIDSVMHVAATDVERLAASAPKAAR